MQPSSPRAPSRGSRIGAVVQTLSIVILFVTTMGALLLGFITAGGTLLHLPLPIIGAGDAAAGALMLWLGWKIGRTAWQVERSLSGDPGASGADTA